MRNTVQGRWGRTLHIHLLVVYNIWSQSDLGSQCLIRTPPTRARSMYPAISFTNTTNTKQMRLPVCTVHHPDHDSFSFPPCLLPYVQCTKPRSLLSPPQSGPLRSIDRKRAWEGQYIFNRSKKMTSKTIRSGNRRSAICCSGGLGRGDCWDSRCRQRGWSWSCHGRCHWIPGRWWRRRRRCSGPGSGRQSRR